MARATSIATALVLVALSIREASACIGGTSVGSTAGARRAAITKTAQSADNTVVQTADGASGTGAAIPTDDLTAVQGMLGSKVQIDLVSSDGYEMAAGGPVDSGSALDCSFDTSCCWTNSISPLDQLEWALGTGAPNPALLAVRFGNTTRMPESPYLLTVSSTAPSDEAHYSSCSIPCTNGDIVVTVKHWATENVLLQVCTRASFYNDPFQAPLLHCRDLPFEEFETTVTLPAGKLIDLVIVASNLIAIEGDAAIVDDIMVSYAPCDTTATNVETPEDSTAAETETNPGGTGVARLVERAPPTLPANLFGDYDFMDMSNVCKQVPCTFESDMCAWTDLFTSGVPEFEREFELGEISFGNPVTGVPFTPGVSKFAAASLGEGERAGLITIVEVTTPIVVSVNYFAAADGLVVRGCCDEATQCPLSTDGMATHGSRQWMNTKFSCPPDTKYIIFMCDNMKANQGSCAFDNVEVFRMPSESEPLLPCSTDGDFAPADVETDTAGALVDSIIDEPTVGQ